LGIGKERVFNPETIKMMRAALDDAWNSLRPDEQAKSSKTALAVFILDAAANGERDPARLRIRALAGAVSKL
jgi:hypothetical protein